MSDELLSESVGLYPHSPTECGFCNWRANLRLNPKEYTLPAEIRLSFANPCCGIVSSVVCSPSWEAVARQDLVNLVRAHWEACPVRAPSGPAGSGLDVVRKVVMEAYEKKRQIPLRGVTTVFVSGS